MARSNGPSPSQVTNSRLTLRPLHYGVAALVFGLLLLAIQFLYPRASIPRFQQVDVSTQKPASKESCLAAVAEAAKSHLEQAKSIDLAFEQAEHHLIIFSLPLLMLGSASVAAGLTLIANRNKQPLPRKAIIKNSILAFIAGFLGFAFFRAVTLNYREVFKVKAIYQGRVANQENQQYCDTQFK